MCVKNAFHIVLQSYAYGDHVKFQSYLWYFDRHLFSFLSFVSIENSTRFRNRSFQSNVKHVLVAAVVSVVIQLILLTPVYSHRSLNIKLSLCSRYFHYSFDYPVKLLLAVAAADVDVCHYHAYLAAMVDETLIVVLSDAPVVRKCHVNSRFSAKCPCNVYSSKAVLIMAPNRYVWLHYVSYRFPCHDRSNYRMCHSNC